MNAPVTLFPDGETETVITDETDNTAFMGAVFSDLAGGTLPVVVGFRGNPNKVPNRCWSGSAWRDGETVFSSDQNLYFSLAAYHANEKGEYRRQKKHFVALYAVMLDDIGGKIPRELLTLPPSWLLETSPGNYQTGYLLAVPITDIRDTDRLMKAIIRAGLCDPGADGPTARLARLPVGVNGKHDPPFRCRLEVWNPDIRYTMDELVEGLGLELLEDARKVGKKGKASKPRPMQGEAVLTPPPTDNPVIAALRERGLYKASLGDGRHDITCPWVHEHTDAVDDGSAYFEPDVSHPVGGYKCHHGHCAGRHIRDLIEVLGVDPGKAGMKPFLRVIPGDLHLVVDAAERVLAESGEYFQRGGLIVAIWTDPGTKSTVIRMVTQPRLVHALSRLANWEKYDARSEDLVRADPPTRHTTVLADGGDYRYLLPLEGLAHQPYLLGDGSLVQSPGYDAASRMYGVFDPKVFNDWDYPDRDAARAAMDRILGLLEEFDFAEGSDRSAALAAILTAAVRPSLPYAPMFHVTAHMPGSGKSYLCKLFSAFASPRLGTPTTFPKDDEECRKLLVAELVEGPAVIEFDNMTGDLVPHKSLCTVLTSEHYSGRLLGVSKTVTVGTRCLFLSSGNNVGPVQDMARRCITIRLAPRCENPATRDFNNSDPVGEVLANRGGYVSAALTVVRAWLAAGSPKSDCKPVAGFGEWSDWCRQPLLWLGLDDPVASIFDAMADDPDRDLLDRLLIAWLASFQDRPTMVREALAEAQRSFGGDDELLAVMQDIAGERDEINRRRLGRWINRHAGRIVNGRRFMKGSGSSSSAQWRVESVLSVCEVSFPPIEKSVTAEAYRRASNGE